jgi:hypothetical protein
VKNGGETDVDCGGPCATKCATARSARSARLRERCVLGRLCAAPACADGVTNGGESDVDCGGPCATKCTTGKACVGAGDCASAVCTGNVCQAATCMDAAKNGSETDIDCGGLVCAPCGANLGCLAPSDCQSGACVNNLCQGVSCSDQVKNGTETDVDCGGSCATKCATGKVCAVGGDCQSSVCTNAVCVAPTCMDAVKNGSETDVDCGGGTCATCALGKTCVLSSDCASGVCAGTCISDITVRVLRLGTGAAALASTATPGFVEAFKLDGSSGGATIDLPTVQNGLHRTLTFSGTATSEGGLSRSSDGHYITLVGYDAAVGTASITSSTSATINRIVGRIDAAGLVDTTTRLDASFSGGNPRSATTSNGTDLWISGTASPAATGGVWYTTLGAITGAVQVLAAPSNVRADHIFGGQLYASSGSGAFVNVFTVGVGLPTMAGQTATSLPGMPVAAGPSPYSFVFFDRNAGIPGLDTLYLADDRAAASGGGIQKWVFDGANWILAYTLKGAITTGYRGLAGVVTGPDVTLIATTTEANANKLVTFVDDGTGTASSTIIATALANTVYRGVAVAPN